MTYNTPLKFNIILRDTSKWHIDMTYISPLKFNLSLRGFGKTLILVCHFYVCSFEESFITPGILYKRRFSFNQSSTLPFDWISSNFRWMHSTENITFVDNTEIWSELRNVDLSALISAGDHYNFYYYRCTYNCPLRTIPCNGGQSGKLL